MTKFVATFASYFAFILLLLSANVASRSLHYDDAELVSDGGASTRVEEPFLRLKSIDSYEEQCNHMYGFLPCSSNLLGHICLVMVYEFLLYHAESWAGGDGRIFRVFGKNRWVSYFSQLLDALPDSAILLAMGLSTSEEKAQEYVVTGAGMLAGSSIFLLSLLWGVCFCCSQKELYVKPNDNVKSEVRQSKIKATLSKVKSQVIQLSTGYGVITDAETKYHARVLFYSLIPFIIILVPKEVDFSYSSPAYKNGLLVSLLISVLCVISYFIYQYVDKDERIQKRRREYAEVEQKVEMKIPFYEVEALMLEREKHFMIMEKGMEKKLMGNPEKSDEKLTMKEFYDEFKVWIEQTRQFMYDPSSFAKSQTEYSQVLELLLENKEFFIRQIPPMLECVKREVAQNGVPNGAQDGAQDKWVISRFFKSMDADNNDRITPDELKKFIMKVNDKELQVDDGIAEIMMRHLDTDSDGNIDKSEFETGVSKLLEYSRKLTNQSEGGNQKTQMNSLVEAKAKAAKTQEMIWAIIWLFFGIILLGGLAEPLVESVKDLSESLRIGPFYLWFILVPLAINIRTGIAAYRAARQKRHKTISVTFSEIYHKVFMNNIVGFFVIVAVIYFRDLRWHFSAELLVVIIVCIIMGIFGSFKSKFPNWTLLIVFPLYPISLLVVYLVNDVFQST